MKLTWFDGRLMPPRPKDLEPGRKLEGNGAVLIGDNGTIMHGSHGAGGVRIIPEVKMKAYKRPEKTLPRVKGGMGGHEQDWILRLQGRQTRQLDLRLRRPADRDGPARRARHADQRHAARMGPGEYEDHQQ